MLTTGVVDGKDLVVYVDGTAIAGATNFSFNPSKDFRNVSKKATGHDQEFKPGSKEWTASVDSLFAFDDAYGYNELFDAYNDDTKVEVRFSTEVTDDERFYGDAYVSSVPMESPNQGDNVTYSVDFQGTGAVSRETVT